MHIYTVYYIRYRFPSTNKLNPTVDIFKLHYSYTASRQNYVSPEQKVLYFPTMSGKRVSLK